MPVAAADHPNCLKLMSRAPHGRTGCYLGRFADMPELQIFDTASQEVALAHNGVPREEAACIAPGVSS